MCLVLYLATETEILPRSGEFFSIESINDSSENVVQWFSLPHIVLLGAHTGCSCGFPHVLAEEPIPYFDGMFDDSKDREDDLVSCTDLLCLVGKCLSTSEYIELFPVWNGEESLPPKGTVALDYSSITPETLCFTEHFLYRVSRHPA